MDPETGDLFLAQATDLVIRNNRTDSLNSLHDVHDYPINTIAFDQARGQIVSLDQQGILHVRDADSGET